jgi:non-ribosomal peptide synthetase component E (peptide arylation enzyme)
VASFDKYEWRTDMIPIRYTKEEFDRLTREGHWGQSLDFEEANASKYPNKEALVDSRNRLTFFQIKQKSDRLASGFIELGLKKDQRIVLQVPNMVEYYVVRAALKKAGLIGLYTMMTLRHKEIEFICKQIEAVGVVTIAGFHGFNYFNMIQEISPNLPNLKHIFVVGDQVPQGAISITEMMELSLEKQYPPDYFDKTMIKQGEISELKMTSGTTGLPKLTESTLTGFPAMDQLKEKFKVTHDDIFAALAPLTGGASGSAICKGIALKEGCKIVMLERFDAEPALELIEREKVTFATGVPTMMIRMVQHPNFDKYDLSLLRVWHTAGAYLPPAVTKETQEKMGCKVVNHYGSMDIGMASATSVDDTLEVRLSSVGRPMAGVTLKLIDEQGQEVSQGEVGEIIWSSQRPGISYYRDLKATLAKETGGLSRTGDLGKLDEHGNLFIVGRKKDVIIRGGQNIYPAEIESMLIAHPKVSNVAIVAMPDPVMGEKACAYIIPKPGQTITFDEMASFLMGKKIAKYKLPERLEVVDSFPMSGDGQKVMKRELTEMVTSKLKVEGIVS